MFYLIKKIIKYLKLKIIAGDFGILIKKPFTRTKRLINGFFFLIQIKKFPQRIPIRDLVDFIFLSRNEIICPKQVKSEIFELLKILSKKKIKHILEIGTANGGTLFLFSRIAQQDATIISIDLPGGKYGGGYSEWKIPLIKRFILPNQKLFLIKGNSHNNKTMEETKKILRNNTLDFLFIDGDHLYDGVKKDFEMYVPLVKDGGIISLHDIAEHPPKIRVEVKKLWDEIKINYNYKEIIENKNQKWAGIGIIYK